MIQKSDGKWDWDVIAAFAAVYVIWGSTFLAIHYALEGLPPFAMAGARFFFAGLILYVAARLRGAPPPTRAHWRSAAVIGALLLQLGNGGVVLAQLQVHSGLVALLISTEPMWVVLLDRLWKRSPIPDPRIVVGILGGFAGVALLVAPSPGGFLIDPMHALLVLIASIAWAAGSLYSRGAALPASPLLSGGIEMLVGGAMLLLTSALTGEWRGFDASRITWRSLAALAYLSVFGSIIAYTAYIWLLKKTSIARVSTYAYVNPVIAVFLGWLVADEPVTLRTVLAAAIIVSGVLLITTHPVRTARQPKKFL